MSEIREWEEGDEAAYVEVAELLFGESEHTPENVVNGVRQLLCELDSLRAESAALSFIVSRWRRMIGPGDPVWSLMHDVHGMIAAQTDLVRYVVERCAALAEKEE